MNISGFSKYTLCFGLFPTLFFAGSFAQCIPLGSTCADAIIQEGSCVASDPTDPCSIDGTQINTTIPQICLSDGSCGDGASSTETVSCKAGVDRDACYQKRAREQPLPGKLKLAIPWESEEDVVTDTSIITSVDSEKSFIKTVKTFNEGLWIIIIVATMGVLIYAGFVLLTSMGNAEKMKTANNVLFYAGIGIGIALFAYVIVNILVNFF